jgi:cell division septation protein DedD
MNEKIIRAVLLKRSKSIMKKRITYLTVSLFLVFSFPVSALAEAGTDGTTPQAVDSSASTSTPSTTAPATSTPASTGATTATTPASTTTGPSSPTGADADTYTFNASTGLWENQYYTWDPVTHQTSPKTQQDYSYNPNTGKWDTNQYVYDAPTGAYVPNVVSSPSNPNPTSSLQANNQAGNNVSNTGPESTNTVNNNSTNNAYFNLFYDAKISNTLNQSAVSGAAAVMGNTVGGSAISGNAMDVTNVINMLKSTFGLQNAADLMTFSTNINGNVTGDLYIDPSQLGPNSLTTSNSNAQNNVTINSTGSGLINNDITLGATSGNATVDSNTNAGSASTGNADAVANVVNMINSAIAANKSFLGVININGNLDGDILLPPSFLDQLIASNAPHATIALNNETTNNLAVNSTNNEAINNDITLASASGAANVSNNTNAGSANTGSAKTNLTVFNLTGKQVVAKDSILVFVNVLGQWVGLIMDAPAGTTAAALGGNVTTNNTLANNVNINSQTNNVINNNLNVNSKSGDAGVTNNTNAGDATTGDATASANIANVIDSQLSASDWFGLLFINVLGTWHGSFGIDTDAGTIIKQLEQAATADNNPAGATVAAATPAKVSVFHFAPKNSGAGGVFSSPSLEHEANTGANSESSDSNNGHPIILASSVNSGHSDPSKGVTNPAKIASDPSHNKWILPFASFAAVFAATGAIGSTGESTDKLYAKFLSRRMNKS